MLNVLKIAMLFIGTIIGAGFATGREISLYFGDANIYNLIWTACLMGVLCVAFLLYGRYNKHFVTANSTLGKVARVFTRFVDFVICVCAILSFCCMVSGTQKLIFDCFSLNNVGIICGVIIAFVSQTKIDFIKYINLIFIPILIILVAILAVMSNQKIVGNFEIMTGVKYCGMNLLLGGAIISEQGQKLSVKQILTISGVVTIIFGALLCLISAVCRNYPLADMPLFAFAYSKNCGIVAGIVILVAIFTTMLSCGKMCSDYFGKMLPSKIYIIVFLIGLVAFSYNWDFATAVNTIYPIEGVIGVIYCIIIVIFLLILAYKNANKKAINYVYVDKRSNKKLSKTKVTNKI